jgi:hypothetical protein
MKKDTLNRIMLKVTISFNGILVELLFLLRKGICLSFDRVLTKFQFFYVFSVLQHYIYVASYNIHTIRIH